MRQCEQFCVTVTFKGDFLLIYLPFLKRKILKVNKLTIREPLIQMIF